MDPLSIVLGLFVLIGGITAVIFYGQAQAERNKAARLANEKLAIEKSRDELGAELQKIKPALAQAKVQAGDKKGKRTDYKRQVHDLKEEVKSLRAKAAAATQGPDHVQLRAELTDAVNQSEEYRVRSERAESELEELRATIDAVGDEDDDVEGGLSEQEVKALKAAHTSRVRELDDRQASDINKMRREHQHELRAIENNLQREIKDLRGQARKAGREVDEQRRRATNNDKAYRIVQLQLDATLEKLALLDPNTAAPGGFYDPEVEAKLKAEAEARRKAEEKAAAKAAKAAEKAAADAAAQAKEEAAQQVAAAAALAAAAADADGNEAAAKPAAEAAVPEAAAKPAAEAAVPEEAAAEQVPTEAADEAPAEAAASEASDEAAAEKAAAEKAAADKAAADKAAADKAAVDKAAADKAAADKAAADEAAVTAAAAKEEAAAAVATDDAEVTTQLPPMEPMDAADLLGDGPLSLDALDDGWSLDDAPVALLTPNKLKKNADA